MITSLKDWKKHQESLKINESNSNTDINIGDIVKYIRPATDLYDDANIKSQLHKYTWVVKEIEEPKSGFMDKNTYIHVKRQDDPNITKIWRLDDCQLVKKDNNESNMNENKISLKSKDDIVDVFTEKGYVILKQKNYKGDREQVIIDNEIINELIDILKNHIANEPKSSKIYNGPKYSVSNKISQDLSDLLSIAVETKDGTNYDNFIKAFNIFEIHYDTKLIKPENGAELVKANNFDWDDEKDFKDTDEDKQDITKRWYKAFKG